MASWIVRMQINGEEAVEFVEADTLEMASSLAIELAQTLNAEWLSTEDLEPARRAAYMTTADPLFFKWQRGEATEQEWLDAVQAVKDQYPDPNPTP